MRLCITRASCVMVGISFGLTSAALALQLPFTSASIIACPVTNPESRTATGPTSSFNEIKSMTSATERFFVARNAAPADSI